MSRMKPCQTNAVRSRNGMQSVCVPEVSNKHKSTQVASCEKIAKLVPFFETVAPRGYGLPGRSVRFMCGWMQNVSLWNLGTVGRIRAPNAKREAIPSKTI